MLRSFTKVYLFFENTNSVCSEVYDFFFDFLTRAHVRAVTPRSFTPCARALTLRSYTKDLPFFGNDYSVC